ncbi:MAG: hypothetical protein KBD36_02300 [Alphaproteobacteria bacterium]|jgi:hypothetical protein|nr:hypothetical protein [Alphaproteobacteria bacterium]MBP9776661.1 hypothetical protein [Alphaproteobacteria bacterium]
MNVYGKKLCLPTYAMLALIGCSFSVHAEAIDAKKAQESRNKLESQKAEEGTLTRKEKEELIINEDNLEPFPG